MTTPASSQPHEQPDDDDPMIDALLAEVAPTAPSRKRRPPDLSAHIVSQVASPDGGRSFENASDDDPMLDALLAEFVPSDPKHRKAPSDLAARILAQLSLSASGDQPEKTSHADPMVDALLAEFVPSNLNKRKTPPDLTERILTQLAAPTSDERGEVTNDADPMIDTLLAEIVPSDPSKRRRPPNLTAQILAKLATPANSGRAPVPVHQLNPINSLSVPRLLSAVVAVAASLAGVMWLAGHGNQPNAPGNGSESTLSVAANLGDSVEGVAPGGGGSGLTGPQGNGFAEEPGPALVQQSPQGIQLDSPSIAPDSDHRMAVQPVPSRVADSVQSAASVTLVASKTADTARDYWRSLGITPTPEATNDELAARLKDRLGVALSEQSLADPQRLRNVLAESSNAAEITKRWLASTASRPVALIERPENSALVNEIARGVSGASKLDVTLTSLIDGSSEHSGRWYETIGRGGTEGIAKQLASISMNADLRCVRCHDSMIGRSGTQDDYWSFVALVRSVFRRPNDRWVVSNPSKSDPTFFELRDGRQRMALPKVSAHLLEAEGEIKDFQAWTKTLAGSRGLAGSMVDSLWKLVHGRKLKPSPVDAFAPPVDESLNRLHDQLAADLTSSGFDVARTLALIISSPMARRSVPEALRSEAMWTATDKQRSDALELVGAFAASVKAPRASRGVRVDVAMRRVGGRLKGDGQGAILAQPIYGNPRDPKARPQPGELNPVIRFSQRLSVDFPGDDASLPVSWLRSIDNYDQQVQHLVYLSGGDKVSEELKNASKRLKESASAESALSRIWWILRD